MLSLRSTDEKFKIRFEVIENGTGIFYGVIDDVSHSIPNANFSTPRRILRIDRLLPIKPSMAIRSQAGTTYIIAQQGDSESASGLVFRSFRLFQAYKKFHWQRLIEDVDLVTNLPENDGTLQDMSPAYIWGSYEPTPEQFDRQTHISQETALFITNQPIQRGDKIDGKAVLRVDEELGVYIANLS